MMVVIPIPSPRNKIALLAVLLFAFKVVLDKLHASCVPCIVVLITKDVTIDTWKDETIETIIK